MTTSHTIVRFLSHAHKLQNTAISNSASMSNDEYRIQVQNQLQDLVAGNRPRDSYLSRVSTRRLILEGVVEAIRIYRLQKQEQVHRQRGARMSGREREDQEGDRHRHRHRHHDRERDGERGRHRQHHRDRSGERHHRHRSRDRSHDDTRRRERSRRRDTSRDASRHRHRHRDRLGGRDSRRRRRAREIPDPVTEGPPDDNPRYMMTGGAGPAGTLAPSHHSPPPLRPRSRSRSGSPPRPPPKEPPPGQVGVARSPTRPRGPDGTTPFGSLPKRAAGEGFATHAFKVYRHVKAEHEHGHRDRSAIEKAVDAWRGKGGAKGRAGEDWRGEKLRKERGRGDEERRGKGGDRRRREDVSRQNHLEQGENRPRGDNRESQGTPRGIPPAGPVPVQSSSQSALPYTSQGPVRQHPTPPPVVHVENTTPPSPNIHINPPAWPPTPETFAPPSRSVSPPYPDQPRGSPNILPMPQSTPNPPPPLPSPTESSISSFHMPPPPPPPPLARKPLPSKTALLDQIQTGRRLRRVASADKKDKSQAASAGRVYDETAHSREVEGRERAQERGWSDDGGSETESERMRRLRLRLGRGR